MASLFHVRKRGYLSVAKPILLVCWFMKWYKDMQSVHITDVSHSKERHCYAIFVENLTVELLHNFRFGFVNNIDLIYRLICSFHLCCLLQLA